MSATTVIDMKTFVISVADGVPHSVNTAMICCLNL